MNYHTIKAEQIIFNIYHTYIVENYRFSNKWCHFKVYNNFYGFLLSKEMCDSGGL